MPITGTWKEQRNIQAGARIWGSGWNPIHAVPDAYGGRNIAPNTQMEARDYEIVDLNAPYTTYETDPSAEVPYFGYGEYNGSAERPPWTETSPNHRNIDDYPPMNANGDVIRSHRIGTDARETSKKNPMDEALNGWTNKENTAVTDSQPSDPSQYEMQTSMTQRDKVRNMSQTTGRASTYSAPIVSRIIGEKLKRLVGSPERLADMFPRQQAVMVRPFWMRSAGTDLPEKMYTNQNYQSVPLQRVPPGDPYQGASLSGSSQGYYSTDWTVGYD